uniref:MyTH4 domain-containing protein n=1 Tax=Meleagris gallopavo TaxID=9103 RepID=G1N0C2_MELGA
MSLQASVPSLTSEPSSITSVPAGDHYTMMDFAAVYFRECCLVMACGAERPLGHFLAPWQDHLCLHPSIILYFAALMRFMGDQPKLKNQDDAQCAYEILQENLHDEVYSRLVPTHSVLRGWLLLNLLTGFFLPSNTLMPYATKFLQQASSDPSKIARICQSNLRKNFMYGGRRHLPFPVEMEALLVLMGRGVRILPGCSIYLLLSSLQVAKELLQEICEQMGAGEQEEMQEFALFAIRSTNILVTVNLRRLTWKTPLHFEDKIYTDIHYGQVSNEDGSQLVSTFWHREDLKEYIPKSLQSRISTETLQNHLDRLLRTMQPLRPVDAKIQFIEHVMKQPLFGYNIFLVEKVSNSTIPVPCYFGVNKEQIIVVDSITQELCHIIPLKELQRMRILRPTSEQGLPGIELNYGSAASPKTLWIELSQVSHQP